MIITLGLLGVSFGVSNPSGQLAWIAVICLMGYVASFAISPRANLLAFDRRDLSATNSRSRRRHSGHIQLGFEPNRLAYLSDIGRETRRQLNVSALRIFLGDVMALRLLSRSGNERAYSGRDRSILESGPVVSKNGGPNFLA